MTRFQRIGKSVAASLEKEEKLWLLLFAIVYLVVTAGMASRPFWYDEVVTYQMSRLPSMGLVWGALRDGTDLNPPLFYAATRAAQKLLGPGEIATRMPAILGFLVMCLSIYRFVGKRCPKPYAFAAMLVPLLTSGYRYAAEARPYGLEFAFVGIALLAWQEIDRGARLPLRLAIFYIAMMLALLTHCYAAFALLPIALGEVVRNWSKRQIDWPVWLCFFGLAPVLFVYVPLFAGLRQFAVSNPLFAPMPLSVPFAYRELLGKAIWPLAAAALLLNWKRVAEPGEPRTMPLDEIVCAGALALAPVAAFAVATAVTGMFMERYGLAAMIGLSILAGFYFARAAGGTSAAGGLAVAVLLVWLGLNGGAAVTTLFAADHEHAPALASLDPGLPVVISNGLMFLEADHYEPAAVMARTHFLIDAAAGLKYTRSNVLDLTYPLYQKHFELRGSVDPYRAFLAANPRFFVYGTYDFPTDWLIRRLRDDGVTLKFRSHFQSRYGDALVLEAVQSGEAR